MTPQEQAQGAAGFIESMRGRESLSGSGSTMAATVEIREWLPYVIKTYGIRTISDIPCGDWAWMQAVDLGDAFYRGYDLCEKLIESNRLKYLEVPFKVLNALLETPPQADLILCRDFLVHLTFEHAKEVLDNFRASGSKYLAATSFPGIENRELVQTSTGWGWRPLDMEAEPFNLGKSVDGVKEEFFGERYNRWTKLYRLNP